MPSAIALPPAFADLPVQFVRRVSDVEYSSECPECGGTVHRDGEWPDRFRMFTSGHQRAWCRRCGLFKWADQLSDTAPPTATELDAWRTQQAEREEARRRSAELALANLRDSEQWEVYYQQLDVNGRAYWTERGIPARWIDFWQLGWNPQSRWGPPTATIPLFGADWQVLNVKHRLIGNDTPGGKYRYELHGLPAPLFRSDPGASLTGHVVAVEGEVKAAVVKVTLNDATNVVGLPGATPPQSTLTELQEAERVTLIMDPGAELEAERIACALGNERCRVLIPHTKIDDGILASKMTGHELHMLLAQAGRC